LHCPKCGQTFIQECCGQVEVDICAICKGLRFDANELDTILENTKQSGPFRRLLKIVCG